MLLRTNPEELVALFFGGEEALSLSLTQLSHRVLSVGRRLFSAVRLGKLESGRVVVAGFPSWKVVGGEKMKSKFV